MPVLKHDHKLQSMFSLLMVLVPSNVCFCDAGKILNFLKQENALFGGSCRYGGTCIANIAYIGTFLP